MTWGSNPEPDPPDISGRVAAGSAFSLYAAFALLAVVGVVQRDCDGGHWDWDRVPAAARVQR